MIKIQINQFNLLLMAGIRMYPVASLLAFQWQIKSFSMYLIPPLRGSIRKPHSSGLRRMTFANVSMALSRVHENRAVFSAFVFLDFSNPLQCRVYIFTSSFLYQLQRLSSIVTTKPTLLIKVIQSISDVTNKIHQSYRYAVLYSRRESLVHAQLHGVRRSISVI